MALQVKKFHKLSVYLIKDTVSVFRDVLKSRVSATEYKIKKKFQLNGVVYVGVRKSNEANWKELLDEGVDGQLPNFESSSNRAVVLLLIDKRIFALPFGYGKHLIKEELIEREFGLKTVLNIINADGLRSVDKANLDDLTVLTKTQASRRAKPQEFNIDIIRDLLRGVTGEPSTGNEALGKIITGNEGVYIIPPLEFGDINNILKTLKKAYAGRKYKERFGWIDNLKVEKDPSIIGQLQQKLIASLQAKDEVATHLSPPYVIDWESFDGFSFTPKGELETAFEMSSFYNNYYSELVTLDWDKLIRFKIYIKYTSSEHKTPIPLWRCLNYQTDYNNYVYAFAFSQWFRVNKRFSDEIKNYANGIEESKLNFIDCGRKMNEGDYNSKLAAASKNRYLMDKQLVKTDLTRSAIEVCDVLSKQGDFIHVKFSKSSSMLSHLFAQGRMSGTMIAKDRLFRKNLRTKLNSIGLNNLVPLESKDLDTSKYTITFAIIDDKKKSFVESLPFFSLLNFRLTAEDLILIGFKVRVKKILIV